MGITVNQEAVFHRFMILTFYVLNKKINLSLLLNLLFLQKNYRPWQL